jgi:hypothetical protein
MTTMMMMMIKDTGHFPIFKMQLKEDRTPGEGQGKK